MSAPTSRRGLLAGAGSAAASIGLLGATPPARAVTILGGQPSDEAPLIALCAECERLEAEHTALIWASDKFNPRYNLPGQKAAEAALHNATARQQELLGEIAAFPASTREGLRAKAQAVHAFFVGMPPEAGSIAGDALWSLVCDVAGRAAA